MVLYRGRERGHVNLGWHEAYYTFSFASHYDPARRRFRSLRALNECWLAPRAGFGKHSHGHLEIVTLVLEGALEQRDRSGKTLLTTGAVQRLTAGHGMTHVEFNPSWRDRAHYLELWIEPDRADLEPCREQRSLPGEGCSGSLQVIGSPKNGNGIVQIHQDVEVLFGELAARTRVTRAMPSGRYAWLQVLAGAVSANGQILEAGDGAAINSGGRLSLAAVSEAKVLFLELP